MPLLKIGAGNSGDCRDGNNVPLMTYQRGFHRPIDGDRNGSAICDIGAYEYYPYSLFLPLITK